MRRLKVQAERKHRVRKLRDLVIFAVFGAVCVALVGALFFLKSHAPVADEDSTSSLLSVGSGAAATNTPAQRPSRCSSVPGNLATAGTAPELFVGTWQDTADSRSRMTFAADGTLTTCYEGMDATRSGTWELIPTAEVPDIADAAAQSAEPALHTQLTFDGQHPRDQYLGIGELTTDTIRLIHLPRGNTLTYTRVH
ncbi:hypothetical protein HG717_00785 [Rhodococcus erythropolis]|uniref:hypothetical protein n=1 Tax=Rhodococcus erythropolis TaxID=1833 RepID=UPI001C9BA4D4|nr:hypothetical protein [Rhodococcus erythropolis]MBY6382457.1 hypothetical protein [Rhodococcus erythropolis]